MNRYRVTLSELEQSGEKMKHKQETLEADKVCFNAGFAMFYVKIPNTPVEELVRAFSTWGIVGIEKL